MARYMTQDDKLFRAIVRYTFESGHTLTTFHGPFTAKAPATTVIYSEKARLAYQERVGWSWQGPYELSTSIESCDPAWKEV